MPKTPLMKATETKMTPDEYLKRPYARFVTPDADGTFMAEIMEFPGCIAVGETAGEALANLESVASSWLEVVLAKGQRVPEPVENVKFSGKLVVRLPRSVHRKAAHFAARDGVSLNQFIVSSISEQVGMRSFAPAFSQFGVTVQLSASAIPIEQAIRPQLTTSTAMTIDPVPAVRAYARG